MLYEKPAISGCIVIGDMCPDDELPSLSDLAMHAKRAERELSKASEYFVESRYLASNAFPVIEVHLNGQEHQITNRDVLDVLRPFSYGIALDSAKPGRIVNAPRWGSLAGRGAKKLIVFVLLFLDEIRAIVCKGNKRKLSTTSHSLIAVLAAWLADRFNVGHEVSTATATAILITIVSATKGAFCRLAAKDLKRLMEENV